MINQIKKGEKIALCRVCHGSGMLNKCGVVKKCPNCEGSGRVLVSCEMTLHIFPYVSGHPN